MKRNILFTWSSGKDSALALYELQRTNDYEILALLTTITEGYDRISMHGVKSILLEQQVESLGLLVEKIYIKKNESNKEYEAKMKDKLKQYKKRGALSVVFGDIFLEDIRKYREKNLSKLGITALFPLWHRNTTELAHKFIDLGFKAVITCVDSNVLDKKFVGKIFDEKFLSRLPSSVDPCGENGEFHTFVYDGPLFKRRIQFKKGSIVLKENRFYFCDLLSI